MDNSFIKLVLGKSNSEKTRLFNSLSIDDRRTFLGLLSEGEHKKFVSDIRK